MLIGHSIRLLALSASLLLTLSTPLTGHELVRGVGTQTTFTFHQDHLAIELNFGVSAAQAFSILTDIDNDASNKISTEEANRFLAARGNMLIENLALRVNGRSLPMTVLGWEEAGLTGTVMVKPFDAYFTIRAPLPPALAEGGWWLHYRDNTYVDMTSSQFCWLPMLGHGSGLSFRIFEPTQFIDEGTFFRTIGRDLVVFFDEGVPTSDPANTTAPNVDDLAAIPLQGDLQIATEEQAASDSLPAIPRPDSSGIIIDEHEEGGVSEEETIGELIRKLASGEIKMWELLIALLMAITYGAGHALGPGHGKTMVAAYLVGSRGRVRDAVVLGTIVTFAHTFSIFLLGLLLLSLIEASADKASSATYQNWLTTSFSLLSGLLLAGFGLVLARRRWRRARGHTHHHGDGHHHHHHGDGDHHHHHHGEDGHSHVPEGWGDREQPSWRDLVTLGISGGIVPCPAGFTIILVAAHFQALALGLFILLFFSLGLGLVLVAIGIVLVVGKEGLLDRIGSRGSKAMRFLPVLSALLVSAVGGYFVYDSVSRGQESIAQMLRALADRISG